MEAPKAPSSTEKTDKELGATFGDGDAIVSIYQVTEVSTTPIPGATQPPEPKALGQGIIISDMGLVLVDSSILTDKDVYKVILNKVDFDATVIKKFANGFSVLKITQKKAVTDTPTEGVPTTTPVKTQ